MEAGLYNEKDELIMDWKELIDKKYIKIKNNKIVSCDCDIEGKVIMAEGIKKIEEYTFWGCENITEIEIPDSITYIGRKCFTNCEKLTNIKLSLNTTEIEQAAFKNCKKLKEIEIPNKIKEIKEDTFRCCMSLMQITFPKNLKKINKGIFFYTNNVTIKYPGTEEEFKQIEGWENVFDGNKLTFDNIIFYKTLEELIDEGKSFREANAIIKKQNEEQFI